MNKEIIVGIYGFLKDGIYKVTNKNRKYKGFYWFDKRLNEGRETV